MAGRPQPNEAAPYYSRYIDLVESDDIVPALDAQATEVLAFLSGISEEKSLHRYAPDRWSIRQVLSHINDTERVFAFRAFWFARGIESPLPGFDQDPCALAAKADARSWASHVEEFRSVRSATLTLFRSLGDEAWARSGMASGNPFTTRALGFITAGHVAHHIAVLKERYL